MAEFRNPTGYPGSLSVVEQHVLPEELVVPVSDLVGSFGLVT